MDVAEVQLKADASQITKADKALGKFNKTAQKTETTTEKMRKENEKSSAGFTKMASGMGKLVGGIAGIAVAMRGVSAGISVIKDFEVAMDAVAAVSRATGEEMEQMTATARDLGATTAFSATQAAEGMKFLAQAGFTATESISAIPDVLNLARASAMDLGTAADIASNVMSGFGIAAADAGSAADILAGISSRANTNVQQLGDAASYVGPVAKAMGIGLGDASAAIGVLSDAGIQGSAAGTGLRRVLSSLANPSKDATEILGGLGLKMSEVNPATNDLADIIDRLAGVGLSAADALTVFGDRGGPAILSLVANNDRVRELGEEMKTVDGEAKRMAETMGDNLDGDVRELTSAMSELAIALGDAGVNEGLRVITQTATKTIQVFGFLIDETRELFGSISKLDYARLADEQERLTKSLKYMNEGWAQNVFGKNVQGIKEAEEKLAAVTARMNAIANLGPEVQRSLKEMHADWQPRLAKARGLLSQTHIELAKMQKQAAGRESEEAIKAAKEFADALQKVKDAADPLQAEVNQLTDEYEIMRRAMDAGNVSSEEWMNFLDYALPEVVVEAKKLTSETENLAKQSKITETVYTRGIERMRDATGDFFKDMLVNGELSFTGILDMFKNMVAEMIATAATNDIFGAFGMGNGGGGLVDLAKSAFGGGAEGGGFSATSIISGVKSAWGASIETMTTTVTGAVQGFENFVSPALSKWGNGAYATYGPQAAPIAGGGSTVVVRNAAGEIVSGANGTTAAPVGNVNWTNVGISIGAGIVGSELGKLVFEGETTGAGAAVGGAVGSYFGPWWTAVGSFVGEGVETLLGNIFGFGGTSNNRVYQSFADGQAGESYVKDKGAHRAQREAVESVTNIFEILAGAIGGTDFEGQFSASAKHGLELNGDELRTTDSNHFIDTVFEKMLEGADELDGNLKTLYKHFDGNAKELIKFVVATSSALGPTEKLSDEVFEMAKNFEGTADEFTEFVILKELIHDMVAESETLTPAMVALIESFEGAVQAEYLFATAMSDLSGIMADSPVSRAVGDFASAQVAASATIDDAYLAQMGTVNEMIATYDGSFDSTVALNEALLATQASAYAMAMGIETAREQMDAMFSSSANSIRESVMSKDALFDKRTAERDALIESTSEIDDAQQLQEVLTEANRLNDQLFNMISDPTTAQAEEYAGIAEDLAKVSDERLDAMLERLEETQTTQMGHITDALDLYATRQEQTAEAFADAVAIFAASVRAGPNSTNDEVVV